MSMAEFNRKILDFIHFCQAEDYVYPLDQMKLYEFLKQTAREEDKRHTLYCLHYRIFLGRGQILKMAISPSISFLLIMVKSFR